MQDNEPLLKTDHNTGNVIDDHILNKVSTIINKQREKALAKRLRDERYRYIANGLCTLASGTVYATYPTGWRRLTKKHNKYGSH